MNKKKGLKYYTLVFLAALAGLMIYTLIQTLNGSVPFQLETIVFIIVIPIAFTGFLFVFDRVFELILPKRLKHQQTGAPTEFQLFLNEVNMIIKDKIELGLEDTRKLRENDKFQKTLSQIFTIKKHGETEQLTYDYLQKKFKKDTNEYQVVNLVIDAVKKD